MRFPLQAIAKSRTKEEHHAYYQWLSVVLGQGVAPLMKVPTLHRVALWLLDRLPKFAWRRLPLRLRTWHLFTEPTETPDV